MRQFFIAFAVCAAAFPAAAQTVTYAECQTIAEYFPQGNVNYQPGVDVEGKAVVPADLAQGSADALRNAPVVLLRYPQSGHMPMIEEPEKTEQIFIAQVDGGGRQHQYRGRSLAQRRGGLVALRLTVRTSPVMARTDSP